MSDRASQKSRWPCTDYSAAIATAVEWLGDRYLLAKPINPLSSCRASSGAKSAPALNAVVRELLLDGARLPVRARLRLERASAGK